jgi:hypothetical protein
VIRQAFTPPGAVVYQSRAQWQRENWRIDPREAAIFVEGIRYVKRGLFFLAIKPEMSDQNIVWTADSLMIAPNFTGAGGVAFRLSLPPYTVVENITSQSEKGVNHLFDPRWIGMPFYKRAIFHDRRLLFVAQFLRILAKNTNGDLVSPFFRFLNCGH